MPLDAHYLQVFQTLLSERSISQAASRLNTSPSNVRRILNTLEVEVGIPLFDGSERGRVAPTQHADLLQRAMQPFLGEMELFRSLASEVREKEKVLTVGVSSWFNSTGYFQEWLASLNRNSRVGVKLVEVAQGKERCLLESGCCDLVVGPAVIPGKRLATAALSTLHASIGLTNRLSPPDSLQALREIGPWGIHLPDLSSKAREWLRIIELAGGGEGRLVTHSEFLEWSAEPRRSRLKGVIALRPAGINGGDQVEWHPFRLLGEVRITATALSQRPDDCLGQAIQAAAVNLMEHAGNL